MDWDPSGFLPCKTGPALGEFLEPSRSGKYFSGMIEVDNTSHGVTEKLEIYAYKTDSRIPEMPEAKAIFVSKKWGRSITRTI